MKSKTDIFDKWDPVNIDTIPEDLLEDFLGKVRDEELDRKRDAFFQSIRYLSEADFDLLVKRYCLSQAHKTIRRELKTGSTRTIFLRLRKLRGILEGYINYFMEADHEANLQLIEDTFGEDGLLIVNELFIHVTRSRIRKSNRGVITRSRIVEVCDGLLALSKGHPGIEALCKYVLFPQEKSLARQD